MEITNKDVKVLGRVAAITVEGVVASAEQVYDETYEEGMFQDDINKKVNGDIEEINTWISDVQPIENLTIDEICK